MPRSNKKKYKSQPPSHHARPKQPVKPVAAYSPRVQSEVQALFEKKFAFIKPDRGPVWALPLAETLFTAPVVKVCIDQGSRTMRWGRGTPRTMLFVPILSPFMETIAEQTL